MNFYTVFYREPEDSTLQVFECWADDMSHAYEQCRNAYPDVTIDYDRTELDWLFNSI